MTVPRGAAKGGGVDRFTRMMTTDRWPGSVIVATAAAIAAMIATAAVSLVASDEVTLAAPVYARSEVAHGGMRCVRAASDPRLLEQFPDACVVRQMPVEEAAKFRAFDAMHEMARLRGVRPLHEASEVPENAI
ncbi:MAG: hypothetical protein QM783_03000 [Phycisphaerales bacterium]